MPSATHAISTTLGPLIDAVVSVNQPHAQALRRTGGRIPNAIAVRAIVDTGASHSALDAAVIAQLGVQPVDRITVGAGSASTVANRYSVSLLIPSTRGEAPMVRLAIHVLALDLQSQGVQAVIGRDVLKDCLFVYNGVAGESILAF